MTFVIEIVMDGKSIFVRCSMAFVVVNDFLKCNPTCCECFISVHDERKVKSCFCA